MTETQTEISPIELVHDYLIDQRILNIVFDSNKGRLTEKGYITSGGLSSMWDSSVITLVVPLRNAPAITIATINTHKEDDSDQVTLCIYSSLIKLMDVSKWKVAGSFPTEISLNLEDPQSLDNLVEILEGIVVKYNDFAEIMHQVGKGLLSDFLVWDNLRFSSTKLKR